jgi:hypothetical protein
MPELLGQPRGDDLDAFIARRAEVNPDFRALVDAALQARQRDREEEWALRDQFDPVETPDHQAHADTIVSTSAERYLMDRLTDPRYRRQYRRTLKRLRRTEAKLTTYAIRLSEGRVAYVRLPDRLHPRDAERLKAFLRAPALGDSNEADAEADG